MINLVNLSLPGFKSALHFADKAFRPRICIEKIQLRVRVEKCLLFILSVLGNAALGYATWNMLRKQELLEDFVLNAMDRASHTLDHMRTLDNLQMFEMDDDVGPVFRELVADIQQYAEFLGVETPTEQLNATEAQPRP